MAVPELWIIAGPNGAGKTTLTQRKPLSELIPNVCLLNPDDAALDLLRQRGYAGYADAPVDVLRAAFLEAADRVQDQLNQRLRQGETVCVETVLSTSKYRSVVEDVRSAGGLVALVYVALRSPELACCRVEARVRIGGHDVPIDRIASRWRKSLEQLPWFAAMAHRFWVFDNSDPDPDHPPQLLAEGGSGSVIIHHAAAIPEVTATLSTLG